MWKSIIQLSAADKCWMFVKADEAEHSVSIHKLSSESHKN
jgi:hypothetical protein